MQVQSRMKLWREAPINSFLLCTVLAKQARRLGRLQPDRRIPELITIALRNCADYELVLEVGQGRARGGDADRPAHEASRSRRCCES